MRRAMTFSILVVCLNPGEKLQGTLESILEQTEQDLEIIVKDGCSTDGSLALIPQDQRIRVISEKDTGIYDAMNQAVSYAKGELLYFLNCGDALYDREVLARVKECAATQQKKERPLILYGNIRECLTNTVVQSNPVMDDFACYRNVPCHQACFYDRELFAQRGFDLSYRVRADYEQFLWSFYEAEALTVYLPITVALYEGGGFSETKENRKLSAREHQEIVRKYMPEEKVRRYRWTMRLTLAGLRTALSHSPVTAPAYNWIKQKLYKG